MFKLAACPEPFVFTFAVQKCKDWNIRLYTFLSHRRTQPYGVRGCWGIYLDLRRRRSKRTAGNCML